MKTQKIVLTILSLILLCLPVVGCGGIKTAKDYKPASGPAESKPIITVTIIPEKTFVEAVCGDLAEVIALIPPGNSPENYEPTPAEMEKFSKASLYFTIGVPAEANILPNTGSVKVISLKDAVANLYTEIKFESGERDPHIWLSPKRVKVMVRTIASEMGKLDEKNKLIYEKNAENYISKLNGLDREISLALSGVKNRKFIVYHPAFGYLADDYGLKMYALEEEGKEAAPRHMQEMIDLAKNEKIKVIFYQEEIDSSQSKAFAEEIGGKTIKLSPLAADYTGNLKKMAETMAEVME